MTFVDKARQVAAEKSIPDFPNESVYHGGKTTLFMEIACDILALCDPESGSIREPRDEKPNHNYRKGNAYIQAMAPSDMPSKPPPRQTQSRQDFRQQTPEPYQNNRSYDNRSRRGGSRMGSRMGRGNGRNSRYGPQRTNYRCHLCNVLGHSFKHCRTYPDGESGEEVCKTCQGHHTEQPLSLIHI